MTRYLEKLTPDNCAMLMIDHQTGTMLGAQDIQLGQFRSNVLALATGYEVWACYDASGCSDQMSELRADVLHARDPGRRHRRRPGGHLRNPAGRLAQPFGMFGPALGKAFAALAGVSEPDGGRG